MPISVKDCLKIGILNQATVVAGKNGLDRKVDSVTVAEVGLENWAPDNTLYGNELVLSALNFAKDDVDKQCNFILSLNESGVSGLVIFYLGIILKDLDQKVLDAANSINFPIIVMPKNRVDLAYRDVIEDVSIYILNEQKKNLHLFFQTVKQVGKLSSKDKNLKSVIELIGVRYNCSLIITDVLFRPIEFYSNMGIQSKDIEKICNNCQSHYINYNHTNFHTSFQLDSTVDENIMLQVVSLNFNSHKFGFVIAIQMKNENLVSLETLDQIAETIKIYLQLFSPSQSNINYEFNYVDALVGGKQKNIELLSDYNNKTLSYKKIDTMALIQSLDKNIDLSDEQYIIQVFNNIKYQLKMYNFINAVSIQDDKIIILLFDTQKTKQPKILLSKLGNEILTNLKNNLSISAIIGFSENISSIKEINKIYNHYKDNLLIAKSIYPSKNIFWQKNIYFADLCSNVLNNLGDTNRLTNEFMDILNPLLDYDKKHNTDFLSTLQIFLLDCHCSSSQEASKKLFVHPNTVNYRIKRIKEILGYDPEKQPDQSILMLAVAILRCSQMD